MNVTRQPNASSRNPERVHHGADPSPTSAAVARLRDLEFENRAERRTLRLAGCVALVLHLALFAVTVPSLGTADPAAAEPPKVYAMETVRFQPPKPEPEAVIPRERTRKVPIPDPTPDDPEPIYIPEAEEFAVELNDDLVIGIPEEPSQPTTPTGPIHVTSEVEKPERIAGPAPRYTEIARRARIQGIVRLEAIIDEQGHVVDIQVLSGLPMGLTDAAVEAARQWRYSPARLDGKPVAVYFNLAVQFELR